MATAREVSSMIKRFSKQIERANKEIVETLEIIQELEKALETYNADADLDITRGLKRDINKGKKVVDELRSNVDKLDRELSDTNRKYHYLAT